MATARDKPPEEAAEDTSFARGLRVLLTIADRGEIRADELGALLETPLSTIYRYLRTLSDFGFVDRHEGGYRLGPRLLIGGGATVTTETLVRHAEPVLAMLAAETGETAVISRRVGLGAICLFQQESGHPLRVTLPTGSPAPLDREAIGLVLLAFAPSDVQEEVVASSPDAEALRAELAPIAAEGIARSDGAVIPGTVTIAVPVMRDDGIVAAIAVLAPADRATLAWRRRSTRLLTEAATTIARAVGPAVGARAPGEGTFA